MYTTVFVIYRKKLHKPRSNHCLYSVMNENLTLTGSWSLFTPRGYFHTIL